MIFSNARNNVRIHKKQNEQHYKKKKKQHSDTQFTYDNDAGLNHSDACNHSDEEDGDLTHPVEINNPPVVKMADS